MFRTGQIINQSELLRHFKRIVKLLEKQPQAILVTQRSGEHLVLVNAGIFEGLLSQQLGKSGLEVSNSNFREEILGFKS
ncbi:MAG: hypothetical protein DCC75_04480 [Proteobacteria bacterium]|nr:MAG: hypothetical protein DCC75_04480 [Pseudomonadota bacterium]